MSEGVKVRSVEAIELFRRRLLVYIARSKPLVEDAWDDVSRTREWLRVDRRLFWENELRRRKRDLQEAHERYFGARLSALREATSSELMALRKAQANVEAAENKLRLIKKWSAEFEHSVWPLLKQLETLQSTLSSELPAVTRRLDQLVGILDDYAGKSPQQKAPAAGDDEPETSAETPDATTYAKDAAPQLQHQEDTR